MYLNWYDVMLFNTHALVVVIKFHDLLHDKNE